MSLADALKKHHGRVYEVILNEPFETWPIGEAMRLFAMQAREVAEFQKNFNLSVARVRADRK